MRTLGDFRRFLGDIRKETGIEALAADDAGHVAVRVQDAYNVHLQFVEATGKILCFTEVAELPPDAPGEIYRDLLAGGLFGKETAGGYFAIEPERETVIYNYLFDSDRADANHGEFLATIEKIIDLCDKWNARLGDVFPHEATMSPASHEMNGGFVIHP